MASRSNVFWLLCGTLAVGSGCAGKQVETAPTHQLPDGMKSPDAPNPKLTVDGYRIAPEVDPSLGVRVWNAESLFHEGEARYEKKDYPGAITMFGRVMEEFPESRYAAPALLLLGMSELERAQPEAAIPWFQRYLQEYPNGSQRWFAWRGLGDAHAATKEWATSEQDFQTLLSLPGLTPAVIDNGKVRLARAFVEQGKLDEGSAILEETVKRHGPSARGADGLPDDSDTGPMARFYIGEVARLRAESILLKDAIDLAKAEDDLVRKAELTLEAHHQYYRTFAYGMPKWTAAAAYRMGYIYERFYQDLLNSPPPDGLSVEDTVLYREAMDEQLENVVKRAYDLYGQVVRNADILHLEGEWVEQCRLGIARLEERVRNGAPKAAGAGGGAPSKGQSPEPKASGAPAKRKG